MPTALVFDNSIGLETIKDENWSNNSIHPASDFSSFGSICSLPSVEIFEKEAFRKANYIRQNSKRHNIIHATWSNHKSYSHEFNCWICKSAW